jgi:hypothetical protein
MLTILIITLASDQSTLFGSREKIMPRLVQRAAVHESRIVEDAVDCVSKDWPNAILIQSSLILRDEEPYTTLRNLLIDRTRNGCTTIFMMGYFNHLFNELDKSDAFEALLKDHLELQWKPMRRESVITDVVQHEPDMLRTMNLSPMIQNGVTYLSGVPKEQAVYRARKQPERLASVAFARVGSGKVGYIGEIGGEADTLILAMCGLDRPEDAPGRSGETFWSDH